MKTLQKLTICITAGIILLSSPASTVQAAVNNLAFAKVEDYVNIRKKPDDEGEILAMLYKNSAATILEKNNDWYKVKSGTVTGYIKPDFLVTGKDAIALSQKVGKTIATVTVRTLRVRSKASTKARIITLIPKGASYEVTKQYEDWVKIKIDGNTSGYVASDYIKLTKKYQEAVAVNADKALNSSADTVASSNSSSVRDKIVDYALRFVGNPYRWGGTSLTNGADCSGFTQSIFKKYGISIPRTSRGQAASGRWVSLEKIRPGDLIFYRKNGTINHVALYIGNGKVIGAKSSSEGIRITRYNYRTPYKAISYIS